LEGRVMAKKLTNKEREEISYIVSTWIIKNPNLPHKLLIRNIVDKFNVSRPQAYRLVKEVEKTFISKAKARDILVEKEKIIEFINYRLTELVETKHESYIIGYLKLKIELLGLNKMVLDVNVNYSDNIKKMSDEELLKLYEAEVKE